MFGGESIFQNVILMKKFTLEKYFIFDWIKFHKKNQSKNPAFIVGLLN